MPKHRSNYSQQSKEDPSTVLSQKPLRSEISEAQKTLSHPNAESKALYRKRWVLCEIVLFIISGQTAVAANIMNAVSISMSMKNSEEKAS